MPRFFAWRANRLGIPVPGVTVSPRNLRRLLTTVSIIATPPLVGARAQTQVPPDYNSTIFISGLNDSRDVRTSNGTIDKIMAVVWLGRDASQYRDPLHLYGYVANPQPSATQPVYAQSADLRLRPFPADRRTVDVGHSMGGLVARDMAMREPAKAAGVITIASPHGGAPIVDRGPEAAAYVRVTASIVIGGALGGFLGQGPSAFISGFVNNFVLDGLEDTLLGQYGVLGSQAAQDLRTTSPTIQALNSTPDEFAHASVYGRLDPRHAWLKTVVSSRYDDSKYSGALFLYNATSTILGTCRFLHANLIPFPSVPNECRRGYKALTAVDERWWAFATGFDGVFKPQFDGLVPNPNSAYPGTALESETNRLVNGATHHNILWIQDGINTITGAMRDRGMRAP